MRRVADGRALEEGETYEETQSVERNGELVNSVNSAVEGMAHGVSSSEHPPATPTETAGRFVQTNLASWLRRAD